MIEESRVDVCHLSASIGEASVFVVGKRFGGVEGEEGNKSAAADVRRSTAWVPQNSSDESDAVGECMYVLEYSFARLVDENLKLSLGTAALKLGSTKGDLTQCGTACS